MELERLWPSASSALVGDGAVTVNEEIVVAELGCFLSIFGFFRSTR
jgi:hypothetical protein